ncbi:cobalamin biosynthesis protein [Primorskyibacter sp. S187A]|uniref:cobalamin biosynthesis protein n=1 Tax=Primorskyibacter sp. S187A TaxID=3415130 RepID=UPI003C7A06ED
MIVAGFGFRRAATEASLADALADALSRAACDHPIAALATAQDKAATPVFQSFAATQAKPTRAIAAEDLQAQSVLTHSEASLETRRTGSVAEAAALAAAGPGAALLGPRIISQDGMATCALAKGDGP